MPEDPLVVRVVRAYRKALVELEDEALEEMGRRWLTVTKRLEDDILRLAVEFDRRAQAGEAITEQMIWRSERYQQIEAQLAELLKKYDLEYALPRIEKAQRLAGNLGIEMANDAIDATYKDFRIAGNWTRINERAVETMVGFTRNGAPLRDLLTRDYGPLANEMAGTLVNGIARGFHPSDIAAEMSKAFDGAVDHSFLIARTETARTYRTASVEQYRESGVVDGFQRLVHKETACMACLMLDGERFELESELEDHPSGNCMAVPVVRGVGEVEWARGADWFLGLDPEQQAERMGAEKFALWKDGAFDLEQLAGKRHSDVWGDAPRVLSIGELVG